MPDYFAEDVYLPGGWARDVRIRISDGGMIESVQPGQSSENADRLSGPVLPGMANVHSHAFQRAMAGLTERGSAKEETFWSWREVMYRFASRLQPEDLHAIAAQLFVEMLRQGYTAVGEFHYLHNQPDGAPYAARSEMSLRVVEAARSAGIAVTLLPVLYAFGGFGEQPLEDAQKRFRADAGDALAIAEDVRARFADDPCVSVGLAPHSLRAVNASMLADADSGLREMDGAAPIHIHIAEQVKEVEDCLAWSGRRPVEWLLDHAGVDERWCLIHATHAQDSELAALAQTGATAGLCPTTEANLADGLFPFGTFAAAEGRFAIGSDSNISVSPVEELRWLDYGQRLRTGRRTIAGAPFWGSAAESGARALGQPAGAIAKSRRADLLVLDRGNPALTGHSTDTLLGAFVFSGNDNPVDRVMVGGKWVVEGGRHPDEEKTLRAFERTLHRLASA